MDGGGASKRHGKGKHPRVEGGGGKSSGAGKSSGGGSGRGGASGGAKAHGGKPRPKSAHGGGKPGGYFKGKKPDAPVALTREDRKRLKKERAAAKPHADLVKTAKGLWTAILLKEGDPEGRSQLVADLYKAIKGHMLDIATKHDASRVVQVLVTRGTVEHKNAVGDEMKTKLAEMATSKHGRFLIQKLLRFGTPQNKAQVLRAFRGRMLNLGTHANGAHCIEEGFTRAWSSADQWSLYQEFYGREFINFKTDRASMLALLRGDTGDGDKSRRSQALETMHSALRRMAAKELFSLSFTHRLLWEYVSCAPVSDVLALVESLQEAFATLVTTSHGARAAARLLGLANPKERKAMLKMLRGGVADAACHQHAHMVLVRALDVTDDTVLLSKVILAELAADLRRVACDKHGRKVLLHVLTPRSHRYFSQPDLEMLEALMVPATRPAAASAKAAGADDEGTAEAKEDAPVEMVPSSRKDPAVRQSELLKTLAGPLQEVCLTRPHTLATDTYGSDVVLETIRAYAPSNAELGVIEAIAELASADADNGEEERAAEAAAAAAAAAVSKDSGAAAGAGAEGKGAGSDAESGSGSGSDSDGDSDGSDDDDNSDDDYANSARKDAAAAAGAASASSATATSSPFGFFEIAPAALLFKRLLSQCGDVAVAGADADGGAATVSAAFAGALLEHVTGRLCDIAASSNRGAFTIVSLIEALPVGPLRDGAVAEAKAGGAALESAAAANPRAAGLNVLLRVVGLREDTRRGKGKGAKGAGAGAAPATPATAGGKRKAATTGGKAAKGGAEGSGKGKGKGKAHKSAKKARRAA